MINELIFEDTKEFYKTMDKFKEHIFPKLFEKEKMLKQANKYLFNIEDKELQ